MKKIYYIGLGVILLLLVITSIIITKNLSKKKQTSSVSQPTTQEAQPTKQNNSESKKKETVKKEVSQNKLPGVETKSNPKKHIITGNKVTIDIPADVDFTKKCNQKQCEILIYY